MMTDCKAYRFCMDCIEKETTPKYVKLQMKEFMEVCEGKNSKYEVNEKKLKQVENILKLLKMPKGLKVGQSLYTCTAGYQWLFYTAVLCTVYRDDKEKRRYETGILEIARKNFKTYTIATIFILLFLTEPKYSKFYSVAPDGALSKEIREAISETIKSSPMIYMFHEEKRFKILRDYIMFRPFQSQYIPLSFSTSRMDGRLPNAFIADEVGALTTSYPINAMQSGQLNIKNKLGFIISTKYATSENPFEVQVSYAKKILEGTEKNEAVFSLLYEPDTIEGWEDNDLILKQANPVALEIQEIWEDLLKKREVAISLESARENFVTKHCNIVYQGVGTESYIDTKEVADCMQKEKLIWEGKSVYLGLDLSLSNDNTSVSMVALDDDGETVQACSFAFIPEDSIEEKSIVEKVNYKELVKEGFCFPCGDKIIDYGYVEDFVQKLEERYRVHIAAIGYDRWNAISTAQKLERAGFPMIEIKQHSSVLHPATKLLKEKILSKNFKCEYNRLLLINFQNARCTYDNNKNLYVNKKKSVGKVDMVVSLIDAVCLLQQETLNHFNFTVQVL